MISRAIDALKSQLTRARSDMEKLVDLKRLALRDPIGYVGSLLTNTAPQAPFPLEVVDLPTVYVEPYIGCADTAKVQQYMDCVREQVGKGADRLPFISMGSSVTRPLSPSTNVRTNKSVNRRRTSQMSFTAGGGQLTGNTAVGTPEEKSPERHIPNTAATLLPSPTNTIAPPRIERANTEPPAFVATKQPRNFQSIVASRPAETQPSTPTRQGKSQKTLTPQMLEEFRRQVSEKQNPASDNDSKPEECGSDDDEYYNALARASMTEGTKPNKDVSSDSSDSDAPLMSVLPTGSSFNLQQQQQPTGGKSISLNNLPHSRTSLANGGFRRRGRGRPPYKVTASSHGNTRNNRDPRLPRGDDGEKPKSASFNMPWTDQEQERLEELLKIYPEEEVSNNRWRKISKALGTRSMRQVSSRVQKYFIKLARAGLPVPGRVPGQIDGSFSTIGSPSPRRGGNRVSGAHLDNIVRKRKRGRPPKRKHVDFTSSSSESEQEDIDMMEAEIEDNNHRRLLSFGGNPTPYDRKGKQPDMSLSDDVEFVGDGVRSGFGNLDFGNSYDDDQLYTAAPLSSSVIDGASCSYADFDMSASGSNVASSSRPEPADPSTSSHVVTPALRSAKAVHLGYRCDSCFAEPIVGIRWHCLQCKGAQTVDLCDECREEGAYENSHHILSHTFHAVRDAEMEPYYANEVAASALREYSYLA